MDTIDKLVEISSRLDHLENAAEWISKETIHSNNSASQTASLIQALSDDIREKIFELVQELETDLHELSEVVKFH